MSTVKTELNAARKPRPVPTSSLQAAPLPFPRLYRAHISAARDSSLDTERTVFIEAATHQAAARKIANAVAALEMRLPDDVAERIYSVTSSQELIEEGLSEDIELRLFETGWSGGRATHFVESPLFLVADPAPLMRIWVAAVG